MGAGALCCLGRMPVCGSLFAVIPYGIGPLPESLLREAFSVAVLHLERGGRMHRCATGRRDGKISPILSHGFIEGTDFACHL